jgi:hypothetical protein
VFGLYCGLKKVKNGETVFTLSPPTLTIAQVMSQMWYVVLFYLAAGCLAHQPFASICLVAARV